MVTLRVFTTRRLIRCTRFDGSCLRIFAAKCSTEKIGQYGFALGFKLSRERSKKTEAVFLVGSRRSGGKSKSPPNREFSSRFGKEEMSTEDKRRRLRRLVPPWSFLTRQRFLLEKQKKMLKGSHKPVQSISLLIDFRFPLLQSKFLFSIPPVSLRLTAPLATRGAGGFFFPL